MALSEKRYRKVTTGVWNDKHFRKLSDRAQLLFFFILTHPHMTALGAMRASLPGLAAEKGWSEKDFREAFEEVLEKPFVKHDEEASFIWLPNFLKHNPPESPNVVRAWAKALDQLPECDLKDELIVYVKDFTKGLTEGFIKALPEDFAEGVGKTSPNQEQEQEQEEEPPLPPKGGKGVRGNGSRPKKTDAPSKSNPSYVGFKSCFEVYPVKQGEEEAWAEWQRLKRNGTLEEPGYIRDRILLMGAEDDRWKRGMAPLMAKWLKGKRWNDEPFTDPENARDGPAHQTEYVPELD
jgi:hypothetical protein